jgi:23S rRNA (pseudouridine1915-N3)-methyltransferase
MYPIQLIAIGRTKLEPLRQMETHYRTLLKGFCRLEVLELPEGRGDTSRQLREEGDRLRPLLASSRCPVLLDADGPPRSSAAMAAWLGARMDRGESLAFALGSSHGFDPALKHEIREKLSLSPMTFPHDLCRILFLEQLYRSFTILKGKTYHK